MTPSQPDLTRIVDEGRGLEPQERAALLMDWLMNQLAATRCALVPCEAGSAGPPLAFVAKGLGSEGTDLRRVPRGVIARVVATRQPVVANDLAAVPAGPATDTLAMQGVRCYMATPVLQRGELVAVTYVDRLVGASDFSRAEQLAFQSLSVEMAQPLLQIREDERRRDRHVSLGQPVASPALERVLATARKLAPHADVNLLVTGETGVGKEWLARTVHEHSGRTGGFVAVNVNALPGDLFEAELMGTARGAFTGALDRAGAAARAARGTLFLDEIGDLDLSHQIKLLRFVEERIATPLGGREQQLDIRLIAATNRKLDTLVSAGSFRLDLLHRFAAPLEVPPLRERRGEILPLAAAWLEAKARQHGKPVARLEPEAARALEAHPWPGNVRQLQLVLTQAMLLGDGDVIGLEVLGPLLGESGGPAGPAPRGTMNPRSWQGFQDEQDGRLRRYVSDLLDRHEGNVEAAARDAGCPSSTLRSVLKRLGS